MIDWKDLLNVLVTGLVAAVTTFGVTHSQGATNEQAASAAAAAAILAIANHYRQPPTVMVTPAEKMTLPPK